MDPDNTPASDANMSDIETPDIETLRRALSTLNLLSEYLSNTDANLMVFDEVLQTWKAENKWIDTIATDPRSYFTTIGENLLRDELALTGIRMWIDERRSLLNAAIAVTAARLGENVPTAALLLADNPPIDSARQLIDLTDEELGKKLTSYVIDLRDDWAPFKESVDGIQSRIKLAVDNIGEQSKNVYYTVYPIDPVDAN